MIALNDDYLTAVAPRASGPKLAAQRRIIAAIAENFEIVLADYAIDTELRIAHFTAQIAHESDGFRTTQEYASGAAYEGRRDLGNTEPGDGKRFKGRGLIQLTGRANYRAAGKRLKFDLEADPARAAEPLMSLKIACDYWTHWRGAGINPLADRDDLIAVTRAINGGLNGIADRRAYLARAKAILAESSQILSRGATGTDVAEIQRLLLSRGYTLVVDGDFGSKTEAMIMQFQSENALDADGIFGPASRSAILGRQI